MQIINIIIEIALALILLFNGHRSVRLFFTLTGLYGGYQLGKILLTYLKLTGNMTWILPLIIAIILGFLLARLYDYSFIIAGAIIGFNLGKLFALAFNFKDVLPIQLIFAVLLAILLYKGRNTVVSLVTSIVGSIVLLQAISDIFKFNLFNFENMIVISDSLVIKQNILVLIAIVVLSLLGFNYQRKRA